MFCQSPKFDLSISRLYKNIFLDIETRTFGTFKRKQRIDTIFGDPGK